MKATCELSTFNESWGCCPQQWDPTVSFQRATSVLVSTWILDISCSANYSNECNPAPPLKVLPCYKRCPVLTLSPPLQGALTRGTHIDSRKFPLHLFSTALGFHITKPNAPRFLLWFSLSPPPSLSSTWLFTPPSLPTYILPEKFITFSLFEERSKCPFRPLILNYPLWVCGIVAWLLFS